MVEITVELFATLTKYLPAGTRGKRTALRVRDGTTVAQVMERLGVPDETPCVTLVNGRHSDADQILQPGDTLSVFPPLAGGRGAASEGRHIVAPERVPCGILVLPQQGEEAVMAFVNLLGKKGKQLFAGVKAHVAWGDRLMLSLVTVDAGATVPIHSHPHEQAGILLEGELDFTIGQETRRMKAGDTYLIQGNVPHGCIACAGRALVLDIFSPVREEYKT